MVWFIASLVCYLSWREILLQTNEIFIAHLPQLPYLKKKILSEKFESMCSWIARQHVKQFLWGSKHVGVEWCKSRVTTKLNPKLSTKKLFQTPTQFPNIQIFFSKILFLTFSFDETMFSYCLFSLMFRNFFNYFLYQDFSIVYRKLLQWTFNGKTCLIDGNFNVLFTQNPEKKFMLLFVSSNSH